MKQFLKFILILLSLLYVTARKFKTTAESCKITSHVNAIDNVKPETYDLLLSFSTEKQCQFECVLNNPGEAITQLVDSYPFYGRFYYFYKFQKLNTFTNYLYQCGIRSEKMNDFSIMFPRNRQTKILTFGDWSQHKDGLKSYDFLTKAVATNKYDAIVTLGDYAYDLAGRSSKDNGNTFFDWVQPVTSPLPFMLNPGNHEHIDGSWEQYTKRFLMPNKANSNNLYYSYDINDVHFISVPSEFGLKKNQKSTDSLKFKTWFEADVAKNTKRWTVAYMHRPLYCSDDASRCKREAEELRTFFEDLFYNRVDIVVAGHLHSYERMLPVRKGIVDLDSLSPDRNIYNNPRFPVYIICGSTGNREGHPDKYKPLEFSKFVDVAEGVCEIEFTNENMKVRYINSQNETKDSFEILKKLPVQIIINQPQPERLNLLKQLK